MVHLEDTHFRGANGELVFYKLLIGREIIRLNDIFDRADANAWCGYLHEIFPHVYNRSLGDLVREAEEAAAFQRAEAEEAARVAQEQRLAQAEAQERSRLRERLSLKSTDKPGKQRQRKPSSEPNFESKKKLLDASEMPCSESKKKPTSERS